MWIWRGETGLWEQDPATPLNFRGNLLGIAFDPNNSARGYAVGQSGVLLSYGKTWQQEPESAIPQPARGANYTSIAFAGSEAIVIYRRLVPRPTASKAALWSTREAAGRSTPAPPPPSVRVLPGRPRAWPTAGLPSP